MASLDRLVCRYRGHRYVLVYGTLEPDGPSIRGERCKDCKDWLWSTHKNR